MQMAFDAAVIFVLKFLTLFKLSLAILCDRPQPGHQFFYNLQISFKRYRISVDMRYVSPSIYLEIFQHMIWQSLVKRIKIMTSEFVSESVIESILNVNKYFIERRLFEIVVYKSCKLSILSCRICQVNPLTPIVWHWLGLSWPNRENTPLQQEIYPNCWLASNRL
jgi:hypothetical protein